jgi:hypothetical protein
MTTGAPTNYSKFESRFCNQTISHVAIVAPLYSTFMLNSATIGYFLLLQLIEPLSRENMKPLVDFLSKTLLAQSTSMYPCTCNWLLAS